MPYLIDGHNLIAHLPDLDIDDPNDEAKLVLKLRGFCARTRKKCIVIFDKGIPGGYSSLSTTSVKVIFAAAFQSNADRIIMERIVQTKDVKGWTIVSSDQEILAAAAEVGMGHLRSARFAQLLVPTKKPRPHQGLQDNVQVSRTEVEEWLSIFGETTERPPSDKARPVRPRRGKSTQPAASRPGNQAPDSEDAPAEPPVDARMGNAENVHLANNTVDEWLKFFGEQDEPRQPTDPAPQRSDPRKQARYKDRTGRRSPTVHKRMSTSEEMYLSEGEVDAWMEFFGVDDDNDDDMDDD